MTERGRFGITQLPELRYDKDALNERLRQDLELQRRLFDTSKWREYTSKLPPIIGYVPETERKFFTSFFQEYKNREAFFDSHLEGDKNLISKIYAGMPNTMKLIEQDLKSLNYPSVNLRNLEIEKHFIQAGEFSRDPALHIDPLAYLISDVGTLFYRGKAKARYDGQINNDELVEDSIDTSQILIQAPPFAIVRKGPWDVHASPIFREEGERTFMIVRTGLALAA